jgi:hypothetical protein
MVSGDAGIYFLDCLPGIASLCIEQKFVGDLFLLFCSAIALELLTVFRRSFLQCLSLYVRALLDRSLVLSLYASFLHSIALKSLVSFSENQSERFLSPLGWRSRAAFTMILERTSNDCLSDSDSEMKALMDSVKLT